MGDTATCDTATYCGGCACGAVRYESATEPRLAMHCQCRHCQRASGGGHASSMLFTQADVSVTGQLSFIDQQADSGNTVSRGFCPQCGSHVLNQNSGYPDAVFIHAASLDDPGLFVPSMVVYHRYAQEWDHIDPALKRAGAD